MYIQIKMEALIFILVLSFFLVLKNAKATAILTPGRFPAIYNFGDSNSDTGGIAAAFYPPQDPSGETFFKKPSGRASDGRLIIDFIADRLEIPLLSAYLDSIGTNFRHGGNFATGGATVRHNDSWFERGFSPFPLDIQVEHFTQLKNRSAYFYQQGKDIPRLPVPEEFAKALYIIDIGQNDISYGLSAKQTDKQIIASFPDIVNLIASAVKQLYRLGARTFWIHNTGPIGCLPVSTVTLRNPPPGFLDQQGCINYQNALATELNKQLKEKIVELRSQLAQSKLTYVDIYAAKYGLISNASSIGFQNASMICCGYYENGVRISCGNKAMVNGKEIYAGSCENPSKVVSWDGVHYTDAANYYVANQIFNNPSLSDPPI